MEIFIYKEEMELIEKALRHEVELLKMMNHDSLLSVDILSAYVLLDRWLSIKRVYGYKIISKLI